MREIQGTDMNERMEEVTLDDLHEQFKVPMSELTSRSHICHAWARTIHTYQVGAQIKRCLCIGVLYQVDLLYIAILCRSDTKKVGTYGTYFGSYGKQICSHTLVASLKYRAFGVHCCNSPFRFVTKIHENDEGYYVGIRYSV